MKILVTGAAGQLGYDVCVELAKRGIEYKGIDRAELDICDKATVREYLIEYAPDAVIHCAAYTAVDKAEDEPEVCFAVNADGTQNLAEVCKQLGAKLLYISTDYVFPGQGKMFYEVTDNFNPLGVYGASKLAGELAVKSILAKYFIVRISWAFGKNGANFVKTMLRLAETHNEIGVVCDQIGSPTYTKDLAILLCDMIQTEKYGTYHVTNEGICSWAEFAEEIFCLSGKDVQVKHLASAEYPARAARPFNSRLSKNCLTRAGFNRLPKWQDALQRYLIEIEN